MKIAFAISFFDFRNDMRKVINEVSKKHSVVIFGNLEHKSIILSHLNPDIEFRIIEEKRDSFINNLFERLFLLFKKIPLSRRNYFLMEEFKISNAGLSGMKKFKARTVLFFQKISPRIFSYDAFLNKLSYLGHTKIDDIDKFILTTEVLDDYFFVRILREHKNIKIYVYSWDHACKNPKFSKFVRYAAWSEAIRDDISTLQGIPKENIEVSGASQLGYVDMFRKREYRENPDYKYIVFGCAIGIDKLIDSEINIIEKIAGSLMIIKPDWKLIVRPYPVLKVWNVYNKLNSCSNIIIDNSFKTGDMSVSEEATMEKFHTIDNAEAFFHLGTTLGLEACFTRCPSFILNFGYLTKRGVSLYNFIHQYQNEKYLIKPFPQNCIHDIRQFEEVISSLEKEKYREPNRLIPKQFELLSFEAFAENLLN